MKAKRGNGLDKTVQTALKQLRLAAANLSRSAEKGTNGADWGDTFRAASAVAERVANAIEFGPSYCLKGLAETFDQANSQSEIEADMIATTCFHCGEPAMKKTHGFDPRCERHRDV